MTNSGTTTVTSVAVADPMAGAISCPVTTLAPGASTTCTADATYTITQADVDAGHVDNTANATALSPSGATVPSNPSTVSTWVAQRPNPALTKTAAVTDVNADGATDLGDTIQWTFLVENTGNVTLDSIQVDRPDRRRRHAARRPRWPWAADVLHAQPPHVITQADVDAGLVYNTATSLGSRTRHRDDHLQRLVDGHPGRPAVDGVDDEVAPQSLTSTATARPTWATRSSGRSWSRTPARRR